MFGSGAYQVVSKKFCCCLPVRIGVFVLSLLGAVFGGLSAAVVWYTVVRTAKYGTVDGSLSTFSGNATLIDDDFDDDDWDDALNSIALDKTQYIIFIVIGVILTIFTFVSLFGFFGAVFRKRALVAIYSTISWIMLVLNLGIGIYMCIATAARRNELREECEEENQNDAGTNLADAQNDFTSAVCGAATKIGVVLYVVIFVVSWLIQLYACIIVKRYVEQLSEEQAFRHYEAGNKVGSKASTVAGSFYPHQPLGSQVELGPAGPYPYTQADHSYGAKAQITFLHVQDDA